MFMNSSAAQTFYHVAQTSAAVRKSSCNVGGLAVFHVTVSSTAAELDVVVVLQQKHFTTSLLQADGGSPHWNSPVRSKKLNDSNVNCEVSNFNCGDCGFGFNAFAHTHKNVSATIRS